MGKNKEKNEEKPGMRTIRRFQEQERNKEKDLKIIERMQEKKTPETEEEPQLSKIRKLLNYINIIRIIRDRKERIYERTQAEEDRLNEVGMKLSNKFLLDQLIKACDRKKAGLEGRHVHGYMEIKYKDYDWLIANDVLDRACYYAYKDFKRVHFGALNYSMLKEYDITKMYQTLATWPNKVHYDLFPEFEFNRMVLLSLEPIDEAIAIVEDYEPYQLDGYDTSVKLRPANLLNMGFSKYDLPISIVKDTPGKDKFFFEAKTSSEEMSKIRDDILKTEIFNIRQKEKTNDEKIEELTIESATVRKQYADLKHKMLSRSPFSDEYEFEQFEKQYIRKQNQGNIKIDWKKVLIGLGIVVLVIFLIIGCVFLFSPKPSVPETSSLGLYLSSKLSIKGF